MAPIILVVDDTNTDSLIIMNMLKEFNVIPASNGLQALEIINNDLDIDLIILELNMPEINYLYCSQLGGVISPVKEVVNHLGKSSTDKIMAIGLSSFDEEVEVSIVNTSGYTSWADVKNLYIALYQRLLTGETLTLEEANSFQQQLEALRK